MERTTTVAISRDTHKRLLSVKGILERENGRILSFDEVTHALIGSFYKHMGSEKKSGGGEDLTRR
jgi:hypothetical protein